MKKNSIKMQPRPLTMSGHYPLEPLSNSNSTNRHKNARDYVLNMAK